jgi:MoxR-like ATPase
MVRQVFLHDDVLRYISDLVVLTREEERFLLGASPRAMIALSSAAQAIAFLDERDFVKPDDVKRVATYVLAHRLVLTPQARMKQESIDAILKSLILRVKVPILTSK